MIIHSKLPENIKRLIPAAVESLESNSDILFAYLFGSLAKEKLTPLSDVDIAVFLKRDANLLKNKVDTLSILIDILHTDEIDLVILNTASLPLSMRIIENKKIIVDKTPFFRHRYESLIMREYFDFSVNESRIFRRRFFNG